MRLVPDYETDGFTWNDDSEEYEHIIRVGFLTADSKPVGIKSRVEPKGSIPCRFANLTRKENP